MTTSQLPSLLCSISHRISITILITSLVYQVLSVGCLEESGPKLVGFVREFKDFKLLSLKEWRKDNKMAVLLLSNLSQAIFFGNTVIFYTENSLQVSELFFISPS